MDANGIAIPKAVQPLSLTMVYQDRPSLRPIQIIQSVHLIFVTQHAAPNGAFLNINGIYSVCHCPLFAWPPLLVGSLYTHTHSVWPFSNLI